MTPLVLPPGRWWVLHALLPFGAPGSTSVPMNPDARVVDVLAPPPATPAGAARLVVLSPTPELAGPERWFRAVAAGTSFLTGSLGVVGSVVLPAIGGYADDHYLILEVPPP